MIDQETIYYIRDAMLADLDINPEDAWTIAELAHENYDTYFLMCQWMKQTDTNLKEVYFSNLIENVKFYKGIEKDARRDYNC